jgi:phospholipid/cholesterol/gamma-HCH transport system permease protein
MKIKFLSLIGLLSKNFFDSLVHLSRCKIEKKELLGQLIFIGYESLPMALILSSMASMILTLNTAFELNNHGGREIVGALTAISNQREILPLFIAFAIAARCGTAMTAEISTMKVTEQIDVLKVFRIDPLYYILVPRMLSIILLMPLIIAIASIVNFFTSMLVAKYSINIEFGVFLDSAKKVIDLKEYFYPLIKAEIFGIYSVLMSVSVGLAVEGGAKEVGLATTKATAYVIVGIIILNSIITPVLYT